MNYIKYDVLNEFHTWQTKKL